MNWTIKNVDPKTRQKMKLMAVKQNKTISQLLTELVNGKE